MQWRTEVWFQKFLKASGKLQIIQPLFCCGLVLSVGYVWCSSMVHQYSAVTGILSIPQKVRHVNRMAKLQRYGQVEQKIN